jgi:hypothetical protein
VLDVVDRLVQIDVLGRVVEKVDLIVAVDESAEAYANQTYQHPAAIELAE